MNLNILDGPADRVPLEKRFASIESDETQRRERFLERVQELADLREFKLMRTPLLKAVTAVEVALLGEMESDVIEKEIHLSGGNGGPADLFVEAGLTLF